MPYHGYVFSFFKKISFGGVSLAHYKYVLPLWAMLFCAVSWLILRCFYIKKTAEFLLKIIICLVLFNLIVIGWENIHFFDQSKKTSELSFQQISSIKKNNPNIYYIMVDGYPRHDTLQYVFDFNNWPFLNYLQSKGFFIVENSCSNYHHTRASLSSTLNMEYMIDGCGQRPFSLRFLKKQGYTLINVSSNLEFTANWNFFDQYKGLLSLRTFGLHFLRKTAFLPFVNRMELFQKSYIIKNQFKELQKIPGSYKQPIFVFCHILLPHLPFAFDKNGNHPRVEKDIMTINLYDKENLSNYINQITILNKLLKLSIDTILEKSASPPIIILQSDHGSFFIGRSIAYKKPIKDFTQFELKERMSNFSAFYLPEQGSEKLYSEMSNINTFRVIFDHYFGTTFGLLQDKCYWGGGFNEENHKKGIYTTQEINDIKYPYRYEIKKDFKI